MKRYDAGSVVGQGTYLDTSSWEIVQVKEGGRPLKGEPGRQFVRINPAALVVVGPFLGLAFVMAFPFIVFGYTLKVVLAPAGRAVSGAGRAVADTLAVERIPGLSYLLNGRKANSDRADKASGGSDLIQDLSREVERRKKEEN
jgi:hypothetical protein